MGEMCVKGSKWRRALFKGARINNHVLFTMISLRGWGFIEVIKKAKIAKIRRCETTFTRLGPRRINYKEGVWGD